MTELELPQQQPPPMPSLDSLWGPPPDAVAAKPDATSNASHSRPKHGRGTKPLSRTGKQKTAEKQAKRKAASSGAGVVLDGKIAYRATVKNGTVSSYQAFEGANPTEALRAALEGTKGARVVVLGGLLFKPDVELPSARRRQPALAVVAAGTAAWPAANLAAVAACSFTEPHLSKSTTALAGLEGPAPDGFWEALAAAGATAVPLPFVLAPATGSTSEHSDGAWFIVGRGASWLVIISGGRPVAYRELKTGAAALPQAAAMAGVELSRLSKAGGATGVSRQGATTEVYVAGVPSGQKTTEALARAGLRVGDPPLAGVERWEIPVVEQGLALLAVKAATASVPRQSSYASPEVLAKAAEAPAKRRRAAAVAIVAAAALGIAATGVLPMLSASQRLSTAKAALRSASEDKAAVSKWLSLRSQALAAGGAVRQAQGANPAYAAALTLLTSTEPPGTSLTSVIATPPVSSTSGASSSPAGATSQTNGVDMTVQASVKSSTFGPVAAWQRRLEAFGASVEVTSESVLKGTVSLTMTVNVPQKAGKK